ncbi:MAG: phospho-sugar mutase [Clostridiales bacterium]|nr:phospho-sugar mutase [Clostridiales bacterium]
MTIQEQRRAWMDCPAMTDELLAELNSMDSDTANDSFYRTLAFGTGGLRGVLGAGTNRMNLFTVMQATRGLANYLKESFPDPSCAVSCDSRIHSRDFAELTAAVMASMGVRVYLYPRLQPTPMLSYAVRRLNTSGGVMITASHNPAKFNGYKVYGPDGCQITLETADRVQKLISEEPVLADRLPDLSEYLASGMVTYIGEDIIEDYYQAIWKLRIHPSSEPLRLVYSPLNGAGNVPVREILRRMGNIRVDIVKEQENPDGNFPTCPYPNPEFREAMQLAIEKTLETGADMCLATDPDSDRMAAGVRDGDRVEIVSGNDMGVLMIDYLCRNTAPRGGLPRVVVTTIVSTDMADAVCAKYGAELRRVLTGFKFICEQIHFLEEEGHPERFLFGFEESYGYLSGTDVRDKDAVNAALLACEMAANLKAEGKTLLDRLEELRKEFGFFAQRTLNFEYPGENGAKQMAAIMAGLRAPLASYSAPEIASAARKDYLLDDTGLPKSDVLEFRLASGMKFVVRPSGTEPKLKAYLFARGADEPAASAELDRLEALVTSLCK